MPRDILDVQRGILDVRWGIDDVHKGMIDVQRGSHEAPEARRRHLGVGKEHGDEPPALLDRPLQEDRVLGLHPRARERGGCDGEEAVLAFQKAAVDLMDEDVARADLPFVEEEVDAELVEVLGQAADGVRVGAGVGEEGVIADGHRGIFARPPPVLVGGRFRLPVSTELLSSGCLRGRRPRRSDRLLDAGAAMMATATVVTVVGPAVVGIEAARRGEKA